MAEGLVYIVEQEYLGQLNYFLWNPDHASLGNAFWTTHVDPKHNRDKHFLFADDGLYIGLGDGRILRARISSDQETRKNTTAISEICTRTYVKNAKSSERYLAPIKGLVAFNGGIFDASVAGLLNTYNGMPVDDSDIYTVATIENPALGKRLCIVPSDLHRDTQNAGSLIDAFTKEVILYDAVPLDVGLQTPHLILGNAIYTVDRINETMKERSLQHSNLEAESKSQNIEKIFVHDNVVCKQYRSDEHECSIIVPWHADTDHIDVLLREGSLRNIPYPFYVPDRDLRDYTLTSVIGNWTNFKEKDMYLAFYCAENELGPVNQSIIVRAREHAHVLMYPGKLRIYTPIFAE